MDRFLADRDFESLIRGDPVDLVRSYDDPHDQEVAGLLVALLAYGRASVIRDRAGQVLSLLGSSPARAITQPERRAQLDGFVYRFQRGDDLPRFLAAISELRAEHGSLCALFRLGLSADDPDYLPAMDRFVLALRERVAGPLSPGLVFMLPRAEPRGGAAKRVCLYLRWMIRQGGADLGAWRKLGGHDLDPGRLIIPLDTHIARLGRYVGLTERRAQDMRTAREITGRLRDLRGDDPLAYDMALCHLGISGSCPARRDPVRCADCPIRAICRLGPTPKGWPRTA